LVHAGRGEALALGANGIEVDEPRLEQRLRDGFEGSVGFAQEGDAVVEGVEHPSDCSLLGKRWHRHFKVRYVAASQAVEDGSDVDVLGNLVPPLRATHEPSQELRMNKTAF